MPIGMNMNDEKPSRKCDRKSELTVIIFNVKNNKLFI